MKLIETIKGKWDIAYIFKDKTRNHWYIKTEYEGFILYRMYSFEDAIINVLNYVGGYREENESEVFYE